MSDIEEALLNDFIEWRDARASNSPDLSSSAFLREREDLDNRRRIEEALAILEPTRTVHSDDFIGRSDPQSQRGLIVDGTAVMQWAQSIFLNLHHTLAGDRDIIIEKTFAGDITVHRA